jgi:hypothetical protein
MAPFRKLFLPIVVLGLASTAAFHSSGALDEKDALVAATLRHGVAGSPPAPVSSRILALGVDVIRLVHGPTGLFRALHLAGGALLALAAGWMAWIAWSLTDNSGRGRGGSSTAAPLAAAFFAGTATLFGASFAGLAMKGGAFGPLVALLAGAAAAWLASSPRALLGGFLLGLAFAEHPLVLFLLPGFALLAPKRGRARAALGLALGFAALFLSIVDSAGRPLLDVGDPRTPGRVLAQWWHSAPGSFWELGGPRRYGQGFLQLLALSWRNLGPLGIAAAAVGCVGLSRSRGVPFLMLGGLPALALVLGSPADSALAGALASWALLFPANLGFVPLARAFERFAVRVFPRLAQQGAALRAIALGVLGGLILLPLNLSAIDRSAERGVRWAQDSWDGLPKNAILLTANPVHFALASEGDRTDLDVIYTKEGSCLHARRSGNTLYVPPFSERKLSGAVLGEIVGLNQAARGIFIDPELFFDHPLKAELLGGRWSLRPHGLSFRVLLPEEVLARDDEQRRAAASLWESFDLEARNPRSVLRAGLTGQQYYARSLLQSGALHLQLGADEDAERDFLLALSMPEANHSLAAFGLGQILVKGRELSEAAATLEAWADDKDPGVWTALRLLSTIQFRLGNAREAIETIERAIRSLPPDLVADREALKRELANMTKALPPSGVERP